MAQDLQEEVQRLDEEEGLVKTFFIFLLILLYTTEPKCLYTTYVYIMYMDQRTTIQIEKLTLNKLKNLRITKRETYDEILNRLIKNEVENDKK